MRNKQWMQFASLGVLVVAAAVFVTLVFPEASPLPRELGVLKLVSRIGGQEAKNAVDLMHGKGVAPDENLIGSYQGNGLYGTLYVSIYSNSQAAVEAGSQMKGRIQDGSLIFTQLHEITVQSTAVQMCYGIGQAHYFLAAGRNLYWLAVDLPVAQEAIANLVTNLE